MSLITLSHVTHISQDDIKKYLLNVNSHERNVYQHGELIRQYPSSLDEPFALTGIYEIPTNWNVFWLCLDEASKIVTTVENSTSYLVEKYQYHTISDSVSNAIKKYKKSAYYQKAKDAYEARLKAEKQEAERVRQDVPAITARYETLEKEHQELKMVLLSYQTHLRSIKEEVANLDKEVAEKNLPKWLKKDVESLRFTALKHYYQNPIDFKYSRWEAPPDAIRLSNFTDAQKADGTVENSIYEQMRELVNKGF
jgi:hypothetical protein